jgi:GT2 family glycosyltransferase
MNPIISILTPTWNSSLDWFVETVLSVLQQSISNWQWCIVDDGSANQDIKTVLKSLSEKEPRIKVKFTENGNISTATNHALAIATGEFICCLDHDDTLTPRALEISLEKLAKGFDVVYSDEDKIDFSGTNYVHPFFKPDWSPEYFRGVMYVGHLLTIKRDLILGVGGYNKEFDGVQDYELMLRVSEKTNKIGHIPQILYHWRQIRGSISGDVDAKDNIEELQQAAVNRHLQRLGLPAQAEPGVGRHRININPLPRETHPKISLIVNFGNNRVNHHEYLQKLIEQTVYPDYEILAFGRNIQIKNTVIANIPVKTIDLRGIHNHSQIYNIASDMADGEYLLCLKGGAKPLTEDWLRHLLYYAEQPDVGIVGAYSVFPNGTVQHAGIVFHETIYYAMEGFNNSDDGYAGSLVCAREVTAVSRDACMVRKDIFQELGGFNIYFYQDGQDIDFCLRLQNLGKRVIFTPRAVLVNQLAPYNNLANYNQTDYMLLLDTWQNLAETGDRYYNPNFDPGYGNYVIKQKVN